MSISNNNFGDVQSRLESLAHTLDTLNKLESGKTTDFSTTRQEFFTKSAPLRILGTTGAHENWHQKTLKGIEITQKNMSETLTAAMEILRSDDVTDDQKQDIQQKVATILEKFSQAQKGLKTIQNMHTSNPERFSQLSKSSAKLNFLSALKIYDIQRTILGKSENLKMTSPELIVPLDELDPEALKIYAYRIVEAYAQKDEDFLEKADQYFNANMGANIEKALEIHNQLKEKFGTAETDPQQLTTISTIPHYKEAIKLIRENFPGMTLCASTSEQRSKVAQLVQIALCGKIINSEDEFCFQFQELKGLQSQSVEVDHPGSRSYVMHRLDIIEGRSKDQSNAEHLRHNLSAAVQSFAKDCIDRRLNSFRCETFVQKLGGASEPSFFKEFQNRYSQFLKENPKEVYQISEQGTYDEMLKALRTLDLPFEDAESETSLFPESVFFKILEPIITSYLPEPPKEPSHLTIHNELIKQLKAKPFNEDTPLAVAEKLGMDEQKVKEAIDAFWPEENQQRYNQIMEIVISTRMPEETLSSLVEATGLSAREVEPLLRLKGLEMIILMNQALQAKLTEQIVPPTFLDFSHPLNNDFSLNLPPAGHQSSFVFTPDFKSYAIELEWKLNIMKKQLHEEGYNEILASDGLEVARTTSKFKASDMDSSEPPTNTAFNNLRVGWKISEGYLDHLAGLHNPDVLREPIERTLSALTSTEEYSGTLTTGTVAQLTSSLDQLTTSFRMWNNANPSGGIEMVVEGQKIIATLSNLASQLTEGPEKESILQVINETVGTIVDIQQARIEKSIETLTEMGKTVTQDEGLYLTKDRVEKMNEQIEQTAMAFKLWNQNQPDHLKSDSLINKLVREFSVIFESLPVDPAKADLVSHLRETITENLVSVSE
jgi:hypothetical protein